MSDLKATIALATKNAMRGRERERVSALRLVNAEIKQVEIDGRKTLGDDDVIAVLTRMLRQRRDSLGQYEKAGREDLAAVERFEIDVIEEFLPEALSQAEIDEAVRDAIGAVGASSMKDMGKVMGALKGKLAGRADMGVVSGMVRTALSG
ncbi:MAG: GatB/YqeY domain-containing protein [Gammaproteobacteria bacterium]|nr:GatB/YqeY domain-containing protein [Gammaproteobacteria bacterium]